MDADTVRVVKGLRRVELPRLVIVRRGTWRERLAAALIVAALVAAAAYFHDRWADAKQQHLDYLAARDRERLALTEIVIRREGVECRTPPLSEKWVELLGQACKSLGIAHRDLFAAKERK